MISYLNIRFDYVTKKISTSYREGEKWRLFRPLLYEMSLKVNIDFFRLSTKSMLDNSFLHRVTRRLVELSTFYFKILYLIVQFYFTYIFVYCHITRLTLYRYFASDWQRKLIFYYCFY